MRKEPVELPRVHRPPAQLLPALHLWFVAHRGQAIAGSPQSTSVSAPFLTPSVQVGSWHSRRQTPVEKPSAHLPLAQLTPTLHFFPVAQRAQASAVSPQSTSNSPPFFTPSLHVAWTHSRRGTPVEEPSAQVPLAQLLLRPHFLNNGQRGQTIAGSPQSTSDSPLFFAPSVQVAVWQKLPLQTPLAQSAPTVHHVPVPQRGQGVGPPQSLPVS